MDACHYSLEHPGSTIMCQLSVPSLNRTLYIALLVHLRQVDGVFVEHGYSKTCLGRMNVQLSQTLVVLSLELAGSQL